MYFVVQLPRLGEELQRPLVGRHVVVVQDSRWGQGQTACAHREERDRWVCVALLHEFDERRRQGRVEQGSGHENVINRGACLECVRRRLLRARGGGYGVKRGRDIVPGEDGRFRYELGVGIHSGEASLAVVVQVVDWSG